MDNKNPAKIHGFANGNDQFLAAGLEMFTVTTVDATADLTNQYVLDAVIQTISTVGAPVILGTPATHTLVFAMDRKGLPVAGTSSATDNFDTVQEKLAALTGVNTVFDAVTGVGSTPAVFTGTTVALVTGEAFGE